MLNFVVMEMGGVVVYCICVFGFVLFFLIVVCGIVGVGIYFGVGFCFVKDGVVWLFVLLVILYWVLYGLF